MPLTVASTLLLLQKLKHKNLRNHLLNEVDGSSGTFFDLFLLSVFYFAFFFVCLFVLWALAKEHTLVSWHFPPNSHGYSLSGGPVFSQ